MEFEDNQEEVKAEGDIEMGPSYDSKSAQLGGGALVGAPLQMRKPRYKECLKNHAVGLGGHAVDGCGEFLAAGEDGSVDALKCAACNCHRNFHRKEMDPTAAALVHFGYHHHHHHHRPPPGYLPPHHHLTPRPLALPSTSGGGASVGEEMFDDMDMSNPNSGSGSKKRFRTKFSQEQKDKMFEVAEKLDWRIQKQDEAAVQQLCTDYGIRRHVFKVWMHNNKHTLGKKP